jgi:glyoxylase-like metal-dependent hydrolase (beta-lactamase superfamily II)
VLFVGDLAVNWELGNNVGDADADHANWVRALDRLASWKPATVIPGHGIPGDTATLTGQRAYLSAMLEAVQAGIVSGKVPEIDLTAHKPFGADPGRTASQVRTMYRLQTDKINKYKLQNN